ncbi:phospho-sugar mutase [Rhizosphaericola mali]|uniref:Phospho-sugar mutase n=1 Tax=Rhizosphaericola mali TaxID=2545455 RepID=A0A5P2GAS1_9BACT|nr:phospho-sugar mutase [Rhizosphaericola mali]QES90790.1 phospho-sugar mutase [Rhizosphaericola mali]
MDAAIKAKVGSWLSGSYDQDTKNEITKLQESAPDDLVDAFYKDLEFGTGGLRGLMGVGTNRMNKYTVGMATQGFANYLKKTYGDIEISVAIAHDCRNNSRFFAETTANVFASNGIKVFLFDSLRPTPELSFAIRTLGCKGGVVCTASHNPKEYNGYKAYWDDGGQLVPPHDKNVIKEVELIQSIDEVKWSGGEANITIIGAEMDEKYIAMVKGLSVYPDVVARQHDLKIVYTPIHGSGIKLVPPVLKAFGFDNVHIVKEQEVPDGNFPTVIYPNPEESEAMTLGLNLAKELDADILLGTDPDADRVAVAIKNNKGEWQLMNGNQTAVLAFSYLIEARKAKGINQPNDMIIKTIVTSEMIDSVAAKNGLSCYNVLTGFKWIAEKIRELEGKENYIVGGEESFGLMIGDQVRDKDSVSAVAILCEMAAYEKDKGRTLFDKLIDLYIQYGLYQEKLIYIVKKGMHGQEEIAQMMADFRANPPQEINGSKVAKIIDYQLGEGKNLLTGESWAIDLPKSNVLQFYTEDGVKISARPSGTEPKIKFYFSVNTTLENKEAYDEKVKALHDKIDATVTSLGWDK